LFIYLTFSQTFGKDAPTCDQRVKSLYLDVAVDMISKAKDYFPSCPPASPNPIDCAEVLRSGRNKSGVYEIWPKSRVMEEKPLQVYCDMDTDDGGWTVIQRRGNFHRPDYFFFKEWESYKTGFGDIDEDFWFGNDNIFALSNQRLYSIRFDLKAMDGEKRYAFYATFWIDDESHNYTLHIQDYHGDAGDSMIERHNSQKFSTKDRDNEGKCANSYKGGWWYSSCHHANLNGVYLKGRNATSSSDGVSWYTFRRFGESMDTTEMKIRPKNFKKLKLSEKPQDL
ncbi:techylectin-5A, partial [Caerostris extrusa]